MYSYIPHTLQDISIMLKSIGISSVDDLFKDIPSSVKTGKPLDIGKGLAEWDVYKTCRDIAAKNKVLTCFAGAGSYDHIIPSAVKHIMGHPEFYTAYTPYQAEISQGILQAVFEFQTMICELTGLDVSNASLYDGFTAAAEACSIALQKKRKGNTILISAGVHPYTIRIIKTYFGSLDINVKIIPLKEGRTSRESLEDQLDDEVAGVLVQSPNFYGVIEDCEGYVDLIHEHSALFMLSVNPLSLGLLKSPAEWGADIAVGEAQPLGIPMSFGGPGAGFIAVQKKLLRKLPGRIVGQTLDRNGKTAYVLTLQAREQHIKRERATSNICTNQALVALGVAAFLAITGSQGLKKMAENNLNTASCFCEQLCAAVPVTKVYDSPVFNEFTVSVPNIIKYRKYMIDAGYLPGIDLSHFDPSLKGQLLLAATEKRTKEEIDQFITLSRRFFDENPV